MPTFPRDSQRGKVYRAEQQAMLDDRMLPEMKDVEAFVRSIEASEWYATYEPPFDGWRVPTKIVLRDGRRCRRALAYGYVDEIALPRRMRKQWVVLHEIAHLWVPDHRRHAPHGPEFVRVFVDLVFRFLGVDDYCKLSVAMRKNGVESVRGRK